MPIRSQKSATPKNSSGQKSFRNHVSPQKLSANKLPTREGWIFVLSLTGLIASFFAILYPGHPGWIVSSHYLYLTWILFLGLYFSDRVFYVSGILSIFLYPTAVYFLRLSHPAFTLAFLKSIFLPLSEIIVVFGLLFFYRKRNEAQVAKTSLKSDTQQKQIAQLQQTLQKERIKSGNLERQIHNQEYTFSLVSSLFQSFLDGSQPFPQVLRDTLLRITKAQKITIFSVQGDKLIPLNAENSPHGTILIEEDPFLKIITRIGRPVWMPEIAASPKLFRFWKQSRHRGIIYLPIFQNGRLRYLVSIDKMPFHLFHSGTAQILRSVLQMAEFSQNFLAGQKKEGSSDQIFGQQELRTPQLFLNVLQHEFRRSQRFQSSFSLIGIRIRLHEDFKEKDVRDAFSHYIQTEIRELDQFFFDSPRQMMWIILPFTGFEEMSLVLNRIDEKLSRLAERSLQEASFDYGFSVFEPEMESPKIMLKQVVEIMQIHSQILQKISRRHAYV